jgi:hypothetical protein
MLDWILLILVTGSGGGNKGRARDWLRRRPWSGRAMLAIWIAAVSIAIVSYVLVRRGAVTVGLCLGTVALGAALVTTMRWRALRRHHRNAY